jgi:hypothetical protein
VRATEAFAATANAASRSRNKMVKPPEKVLQTGYRCGSQELTITLSGLDIPTKERPRGFSAVRKVRLNPIRFQEQASIS